MSYQYILFDLDGTLTDPAEGIRGAVKYALEQFGIEETDKEKLNTFIGPPLLDSFNKYYDFTPEQGAQGAAYFREYYEKQGKLENVEYEGIREMLGNLKKAGKFLAVATSKGENFARDILKHFQMTAYFDFIAGQEVDGLLIKKSVIINRVLQECKITDLEHTVMIGDREHDVIAAKESGVHNIGVLYGYGSQEELTQAGAEKLAKNIPELEKLLMEV